MPSRDEGRGRGEQRMSLLVYNVAEAAKVCKLTQKTLIRYLESGRLKGYRIPGSQSYRIPHTYLMKFLESTDIRPNQKG
jgi:excisionase family DNA binding protein